MKKMFSLICLVLLTGSFFSCTESTSKTSGAKKVNPKHVIMVGFDGFSAHSLKNGVDMPTYRRMMAEGAYSLNTRAILPTISAPNWASMFMGANPDLHGYTKNSQQPSFPPRVTNSDNRFPNIWGLYRDIAPEAEIGFIHEWQGLVYLGDTLSYNFRKKVPMNDENPDGCTPVAVKYIKEKKPNLLAVLFDKPDGTGHAHGWDSPEYYEKMTHLDRCLAEIEQAVIDAGMMDDTIFIIVSDHGGINKGHGGITREEQEVPLLFYGKGIKKGHVIEESTMIYDIAGTMAYILNVEQPQAWIARPIMSIFE